MKFKIGDQVWLVRTKRVTKDKPCQVCYGNKVVHLTLGNGEVHEIPCDWCSQGFNPPTGKETDYWYEIGEYERSIVKGIRVKTEGIRYECSNSLDSPVGYIRHESEVFATIEEAHEASQRIADEANEYRKTEHLRKPKVKDHRSYAWHVGYYQREIKSLEAQIKRAKEKLVICEEKAR